MPSMRHPVLASALAAALAAALPFAAHAESVTLQVEQVTPGADPHTNARVVDIKLGEAELNRMDEIFPGPGGEAPQAYAW